MGSAGKQAGTAAEVGNGDVGHYLAMSLLHRRHVRFAFWWLRFFIKKQQTESRENCTNHSFPWIAEALGRLLGRQVHRTRHRRELSADLHQGARRELRPKTETATWAINKRCFASRLDGMQPRSASGGYRFFLKKQQTDKQSKLHKSIHLRGLRTP